MCYSVDLIMHRSKDRNFFITDRRKKTTAWSKPGPLHSPFYQNLRGLANLYFNFYIKLAGKKCQKSFNHTDAEQHACTTDMSKLRSVMSN